MFSYISRRKPFALIISMLVLVTSLLACNANASFINVSGKDNVAIICPDYISGIKDIDVYSNLTVKEYNLYLNGTNISNMTNPVQNYSGYWFASSMYIERGETPSGNVISLNYQDNNYLFVDSQQRAMFDENVYYQAFFSPLTIPVDPSYITLARVEVNASISIYGAGYPTTRQLQVYNNTLNNWVTIATFNNTGGVVNATVGGLANQVGGMSNCIVLRMQFTATNITYDFSVNSSYLRIYYESSKPIDDTCEYELIDTVAFNSTMHTDGIYNLTATVKDVNDNIYTDQKWITIDNTKPTIQGISVNPSNPNNTEIVTISTNISDTNLNNSYGQYTNVFGNTTTIPNSNNQIFNYKTILPNGSYNFYIYASDNAGNFDFKNKTFTVSYFEKTVYIDNPEILVMATGYTHVNQTAWINITCNYVSNVSIYVNGSFNSTHPNPSSINFSISSSQVATFNIMLEFFYNNTFFKNESFEIHFREKEKVILPSAIISHPSSTFLDDIATIQVDLQNATNATLHVNGSSVGTFGNGLYEYNDSSSNVTEKHYTVEINDLYGNFYKNVSFVILFIEKDVFTITEQSWSIIYNNVSYIPDPISMTITTINVTGINVYVNGSLNQTFSGNSTDTFDIYSSIESSLNIDVVITLSNSTNVTYNFTASILEVPVTYINTPSFTWTHEINDRNITANTWSNFTSELKIYINGTYNQTVVGNSSQSIPFTNLDYGTHIFTIEVYDASSSLYCTRNITVTLNEPITINIIKPSVFISYPPILVEDQAGDVNILLLDSTGFNIDILIDDILENSTFYDGEGSFSIPVPSGIPSDVKINIEIFDLDNVSWQNVSIVIEVIEKVEIFNFLSLQYDNIVYTNHFLYIYGTANFYFDPVIYKNSINVLNNTNVTSFYYQFNVSTSLSDINMKVEVRRENVLIYLRDFTVTVRPSYVIPDGEDKDIIDYIASQWLFFVFLAIIVPIVAYYNHRRRKCEKKSRKSSRDGRRPKIDYSPRRKIDGNNSRENCKKLL